MLHGAGGGGWEWNLWRGVFEAAGHAVVTPDLQPAPDGLAAATLDDYARQATAALRGCDGAAIVVGASLGGLLAQMLATTQPLRALVLVNPLPPLPEASMLPPADLPADAIVPWHSRARFASTCRAMPDADDIARLYAFRRWRDESTAVLARAHAGVELPLPGCPTLLIASELDEDVPPAVTAALAARQSAELICVPGGHLAPLLGGRAAEAARTALGWVQKCCEFTTD